MGSQGSRWAQGELGAWRLPRQSSRDGLAAEAPRGGRPLAARLVAQAGWTTPYHGPRRQAAGGRRADGSALGIVIDQVRPCSSKYRLTEPGGWRGTVPPRWSDGAGVFQVRPVVATAAGKQPGSGRPSAAPMLAMSANGRPAFFLVTDDVNSSIERGDQAGTRRPPDGCLASTFFRGGAAQGDVARRAVRPCDHRLASAQPVGRPRFRRPSSVLRSDGPPARRW